MLIDWHWVPGKSVGPFRFGEHIEGYVAAMSLVKLEREWSQQDWDTYDIPGAESRVSAEDGKITDVLCYDSLEYEGVGLLRKSVEQIRAILGPEETFEEGVGLGAAMYYTRGLGLTIWIDENGYAASASCGFTDEDLDRQDEEERRASGTSEPDRDI